MGIETRSRIGRTKTCLTTATTTTRATNKATTKRTSKENQRKDKNNKLMEIHTDARAKPITLS
jgi:hypothetical protein